LVSVQSPITATGAFLILFFRPQWFKNLIDHIYASETFSFVSMIAFILMQNYQVWLYVSQMRHDEALHFQIIVLWLTPFNLTTSSAYSEFAKVFDTSTR
jgi:hypothetical protein